MKEQNRNLPVEAFKARRARSGPRAAAAKRPPATRVAEAIMAHAAPAAEPLSPAARAILRSC